MKFTLFMAIFTLLIASSAYAEKPRHSGEVENTTLSSTFLTTKHKIEAPTLKAVAFHSDSCGACKILGPRVKQAIDIINPARIDMVKFDFTNKASIEETKTLAKQKGVDNILQKYGAKTGFVVLVNNSGEIVDTLKVDDGTGEIAAKIATAIANAS